MQRTIVIGDVHGCSEELSDLLQELAPGKKDEIIFLGDLINRGPDSHGVLEIYRSLPKARSLLGNHEIRLLKYHRDKDDSVLKPSDWDTLQKLTRRDWETLEEFEGPILLDDQATLLVHGGFLPERPWQEQTLDITTHIQVISPEGRPCKRGECAKGTPWQLRWEGPPFVIYGHAPKASVERHRWTLGIDTGCVMGGHLTACVLPEREIIQVKARRSYTDRPLYY